MICRTFGQKFLSLIIELRLMCPREQLGSFFPKDFQNSLFWDVSKKLSDFWREILGLAVKTAFYASRRTFFGLQRFFTKVSKIDHDRLT